MKIAFVVMAVLFSVGTPAQRPYEYVEGDAMQARIYTLANGLKVYLSVNKERPRIQTCVAVRTGSVNDPAETTGLAHYLEHLMFKGTTHFGTSDVEAERPYLDDIERRYEYYRTQTDPLLRRQLYHEIDSVSQLAAQYNIPNEYDKMMAAIGSEGSNAYTSNDVTCYVEDIPSNEVDNWARVQADRFQNMVVRGFHTELEAVYEEYNMGLARDNNKMWEALFAKLFPHHPYGTQTTIGHGEHLKNPSITNINNYYRVYYQPDNIAICMAGDLDPEQTVQTLETYFGQWQCESVERPVHQPANRLTTVADTTVLGLEAENIMLAWRMPRANSLASDTLEVLARVLYNQMAGLLDLNVNQQMKAQATYAFGETMNEGGYLLVGGRPKPGQGLDEVKQLILDQMALLCGGEFSDDLVGAVVNNEKRDFYRELQSNGFRANQFVNAFINHMDWNQVAGRIDRISGFTKQDVVSFANRHLNGQPYVVVRKVQGEDPNMKKVEKPAITPIPTNNHLHSAFLDEVVGSHPSPIQPVFADYERDITHATSKSGKEILYRQDADERLFTLQFRYPLGQESNPLYEVAADYLDYLGIRELTNEQIKQRFYQLACDYSVRQTVNELQITLSGLSENLASALALLHSVVCEAVADDEAYGEYVDLVEKTRQDEKTSQEANYRALLAYAQFGARNSVTAQPSIDSLRAMNPESLLALLRGVNAYSYSTLYYGPAVLNDLVSMVAMWEKDAPEAKPVPEATPYVRLPTGDSEVVMAPYKAANIYMTQYLNENRMWDVQNAALNALFNEYFGGGMNAIVFQEMREARGLAYSAGARYQSPWRKGEPEFFTTQIITQNDKMVDCIREFRVLLDSVPQREAGFQLAKQGLLKSIATARTTRFSLLGNYVQARTRGLDYDINSRIYTDLQTITLPQLIQFAKDRVSNKDFCIIILGDEQELDGTFLQSLGPVRRLTTEQIFGY